MHYHRAIFFVFSLFLPVLVLAACNYPLATPAPTLLPDNPVYTSAAETIVAQLTQIAGPSSVTPPSTQPVVETEQPEPTPTISETPTVESTLAPPEGTSTAATTAPTAPAATDLASDPRQRLGDPTWQDTFSNSNNWPLYEDEHVSMNIQDGRLEMNAFNADKWESWMISRPDIENFYLEASAQPDTCSELDRYGLIARAPQGNQGYLFGFSCDGRYALRKWDGREFTVLIDWTASEFILTGAGQTNRLGLMAQGSTLSLYANGYLLAETTDDSYDRGSFGPFVGSANTPNFRVNFTEFAYWDLP